MSSLPSVEDLSKTLVTRSPKLVIANSAHQPSRYTASPQDLPAGLDWKHKRVWKACDRCRIKKTKCDGEPPCRRCKSNGMVCMSTNRKKNEPKHLPRGYAEVLENSQHALTCAVRKLYTMVRTGQLWDMAEPETNYQGQPLIHDIVEILGCIHYMTDIPCANAFPETTEDLAVLQTRLQVAQSETEANDAREKMDFGDSSCSIGPCLDCTDEAGGSENEKSMPVNVYDEILWQEYQQRRQLAIQNLNGVTLCTAQPEETALCASVDNVLDRTHTFHILSTPPREDTDFHTASDSQNSLWSRTNDLARYSHLLDGARLYTEQFNCS